MTEYIDREELLVHLRHRVEPIICGEQLVKGVNLALEILEEAVKLFPAADVAPMDHARWTTENCNIPVCSRCFLYVSKATDHPEDATPPYCPHCGAKMDG